MKRPSRVVATILVLLGVGACASDSPITEISGECETAFGGQLCSWARAQGSNVIDVGVTVPITAIEGTPANHEMAWPPVANAALNVPQASVTGLTEFTFFWEPMGHPPKPMETPHFDFHFYLIPPAEREAITCNELDKPAQLPAGYELPDEKLPDDVAKAIGVSTLVGVCIPKMGMHALQTSELTATEPMRGTMVVGYYKQKPIFIEPMISKTMLLEKRSFELPIPQIPGFNGTHPTVFRADYDAVANAYRFTFSGFQSH